MTLTKRLLWGAVALAALGACESADPVSPAGGLTGRAQSITPGGPTGPNPSLAAGTASVRTHISLDPTVADAFGRQNPSGRVGQFGRYFRFADSLWLWPNDILRNASAAKLDPRAPAPTNPNTALNGSGIQLYQPRAPYPNDDYWETFVGAVSGLTPGATYEIAYVQYRVQVNGELDQADRILRGTITAPDNLILTPGTLGRVNSDWTDVAPVGCAPFPAANTNPFVFATEVADATGVLSVDKCWTPNGILWDRTSFGVQSKSMVGRNDNQPFALPNYNYIEVREGTFPNGTVVARLQIAQDLDVNGNPLPNGFAPFPAPNTKAFSTSGQQTRPAAIDTLPSFPIAFAQAVALPAAFGPPDSIIATLTGLRALQGAVYKAWLVNRTTGTAKPAVGHFFRVAGTDTVEQGTNTATFNGGPGTITFITNPYGTIGNPDVSDSLNTLLISIETDASAATPSQIQPLWLNNVLKRVGQATGTTFVFGQFNFGTQNPPQRYIPQGLMAGGVLGDTTLIFFDSTVEGQTAHLRGARFRGNTIEVTFTGLPRPPLGFRYRAYLCSSDNETCDPTSPSANFFPAPISALQSPTGQSLENADVDSPNSNLSTSKILTAVLRFTVSGGQTICNFDRFRLVLEPKTAGEAPQSLPTSFVFDALLPASVRSARSCG